MREPLGDQRRRPAVATADVEHVLVAAQAQLGDELACPFLLRARMGDIVARVPVGHERRALMSASARTVRQFLVVAGVLSARSKKELFSLVRP